MSVSTVKAVLPRNSVSLADLPSRQSECQESRKQKAGDNTQHLVSLLQEQITLQKEELKIQKEDMKNIKISLKKL